MKNNWKIVIVLRWNTNEYTEHIINRSVKIKPRLKSFVLSAAAVSHGVESWTLNKADDGGLTE